MLGGSDLDNFEEDDVEELVEKFVEKRWEEIPPKLLRSFEKKMEKMAKEVEKDMEFLEEETGIFDGLAAVGEVMMAMMDVEIKIRNIVERGERGEISPEEVLRKILKVLEGLQRKIREVKKKVEKGMIIRSFSSFVSLLLFLF